jgi:hypothetical protein
MTLNICGALCAMALVLMGCSVEEGSLAHETTPLQAVSDLTPECCSSMDRTVPESDCDAVSYSAQRCEEAYGGGACEWTCGSCCRPQNGSVPDSYCAQLEQYGEGRCNEVNQGTSCVWTCQ